MAQIFLTTLGQDSHRFETSAAPDPQHTIRLGGQEIPYPYPLAANSDGDVVLHALTNAISGLTKQNVLGRRADELCRAGATDSSAYVRLALEDLATLPRPTRILHVSISIEAARPYLADYLPQMRTRIAALLDLKAEDIGITATTGEGLTDCGRGMGIAVLCLISWVQELEDEPRI
ncbi:MAG: 2-C-methyl-D-erythritol 2,4-cyclodiphosphate synthase [Clostridiaceae bacterium]|nr:2-C-methyl-D-erythritol 2,4-cyclodiphosphate synthase [Clostridiaceae bacterium]